MRTRRDWTGRVVWKYALFQVPGLLLLLAALLVFDHWLPVPGWVYAAVLGGWIVKEVLLFPFLWRSFDDQCHGYSYTPEGGCGRAIERLDPRGRVRTRGELWTAELAEGQGPIEAGARVRIVDRRGLILLVRSDEGGD